MPDKNPVYLIGAKEKRYVEYPIFRIAGYDYGISFNNSRALSLTFWNSFNQHNYMWLKRYDKQWSWVTVVLDAENKKSHFYLNGTEVDSKAGHGSESPWSFTGKLRKYTGKDCYLGTTPSLSEDDSAKYFKGDIADIKIWDRALPQEEVENLHKEIPVDGLIYKYNIEDIEKYNTEVIKEEVKVPNSIVPYRRTARFTCLPHEDEGLVDGKWKKGETTARNERRYVLEMQNGEWNYKNDGIKQVKYELISEEQLTPWAKMINIKL
jgi:hypothetical protein